MSLLLTRQLDLSPEEYISVVILPVPFCPLTLFPFFRVPGLAAPWYGASGAVSTSAPCSHPRQGGVPSPWFPTSLSPRTPRPLCLRAFVTALSTAQPGSDASVPPRRGTQRSPSLFVSFCLCHSIQLSGHAQMLCSRPT